MLIHPKSTFPKMRLDRNLLVDDKSVVEGRVIGIHPSHIFRVIFMKMKLTSLNNKTEILWSVICYFAKEKKRH